MKKFSVSIDEAVKLLRRDKQTLYVAIREGRLKANKRNNRWCIPVSEIRKYQSKLQIRGGD